MARAPDPKRHRAGATRFNEPAVLQVWRDRTALIAGEGFCSIQALWNGAVHGALRSKALFLFQVIKTTRRTKYT